ncbi:hypothetical protein VTG60DRAFT_1660 [Thermothelomyces hinnuleus]
MASPSCLTERPSGNDGGAVGAARAPPPAGGPCPLEALNSDCLMAILRAISSLDDLSAMIRSSPAALRCFVSAKALILRDVMANELGPAIRDALIMSLTDDIDLFAADTFDRTFDIAISGYRESLAADTAPWVPALDADTAVDMARLTRIVLYFVDIYIHLRTQHFGQALDPPGGAAWKVSQTERGRIAQALLRFEIIASLHHPSFTQPPDADRFFTIALELFAGWEVEQISEMAHFILALIRGLQLCGEKRPRIDRNPRRNDYSAQEGLSLPAVYAWLVDGQRRSGGELMGRLMRDSQLSSGKLTYSAVYVPWLMSSHRWLWRRPGNPPAAVLELLGEPSSGQRGDNDDDDAHPLAAAATTTASGSLRFDGESLTDPPWAWVHAWSGRRVRRWGLDLVPERPPDGDWDEYDRVRDLMASWRWLGMVFWDKDRAEALLKTKVLEGCRTGWLANYLDSGTNV